ncbi:MAG: hypothetical protein DHS20C15_33430 [Planctomycetota bacterium]|nr:MAG: hypothetical protein DHS20C15_33430 [Planctomycetota bacterium]
MKFEFRARGLKLSKALRDHVEARLHYALGRFGDRVRRVQVQFTDVNGPRGGEDIECRVLARLAPRGEIVVQELRGNPFAAAALAAQRVGYSASRFFERQNDRRTKG